ncbi:MAG: NUDIX domain-containing protein [Bacteroidetes bacterium]|nr:NUDIX domain-containing protein [Bacteroidota bacterium]
MITIILNEKRIFLTDNYHDLIRLFEIKNAFIYFTIDEDKATELVDQLLISEVMDAIVVGNIETNLEVFKRALTLVKAAGGAVFNDKDEILFIYRHKKWDMPKGKLEPEETLEECALREVCEETGLRNLLIEFEICTTYHIYIEEEMKLKETTWFQMFTDDRWLTPQKDEGIKKAIWVHKNNIRFQLEKTYPSILEIFQKLTEVED